MRSLALAAVLLLAPAFALAAGYAVPNVAARDLSMAGSLHAAQVDAGATFVNPAALSRLDGLSLSLNGAAIDFAASWTDPADATRTASTYTKLAWPPAVYASYSGPISGELRYGVGIGLTIPYGGNVYWPADWPGRFEILTVNRRIYGTYLTGGLQLARWARIGGGLIWYRGTEVLTQADFPISSTRSEAKIAASGNKLAFDVSFELQPIEPVRIAFDYKHKADMTLTGPATFGNPPAAFGALVPDQTATHDLTMPNYMAVGVSYQVLPQLLVTGAFTWERFIVYDRDAFIGDKGTSVIVQRNYHNGHTFRLGAEVAPIEGLKVRAGVLRDISPTPPEWLNASIPDSDVWGVSLGLGYTILKGLDVNVAYFHAFFDQVTTPRTANGTYNVFPGTYDVHANIASIGVSWSPDWFATTRTGT